MSKESIHFFWATLCCMCNNISLKGGGFLPRPKSGAVSSDDHTRRTNSLCERNAGFGIISLGCTSTNHRAFRVLFTGHGKAEIKFIPFRAYRSRDAPPV